MKYRLIVSDIDGTLVNSSRQIAERTKAAIHSFQSLGGVFAIATGRIEESARKYYDELQLKTPAILYNGAKIVELANNKCLMENVLEEEHFIQAVKLLTEMDCSAIVYSSGKAYVRQINDTIRTYMEKDNVLCIQVDDFISCIEGKPNKILIIGNDGIFKKFLDAFESSCSVKPNTVKSEAEYLEILPRNTSKGKALKNLAELLKIPIEQVAAAGDNLNDYEMLKEAGLGIAVSNSAPQLLEAADLVAKSNDEDGVAEIIERIIKGEL
ncbi:MAG TPA: HAD family hydrolase [Clostridia bacterium]|nr:HAD family hydrolase [Clostridia bacterium]